MRIAYFINTLKSINWGGQATSTGIRYLTEKEYQNAEFIPLDLPNLLYKEYRLFQQYYDRKLLNALIDDNKKSVLSILKKMNIPETFFDEYTHICFNGEGAVHYNSGHLIRFMGLLYLAKIKSKTVASINQTIDLNHQKKLEVLVSKIYNSCDFVSVREPLSLEYAHKIGILNCRLIPDAVYGLPKIPSEEVDAITKSYNLPEHYLTVTGSSILKRDSRSVRKMRIIIEAAKTVFPGIPIVFMANAKTDIYLAHKLQEKYQLRILESPTVGYHDAVAIIANADILIGGRQHPNIFAYIYRTPYLAFDGNTFKNRGVSLLQEYPYAPIPFDTSIQKIISLMGEIKNTTITFHDIKIDNFCIFNQE